jgi:uncharacterized membrane protein YkoI
MKTPRLPSYCLALLVVAAACAQAGERGEPHRGAEGGHGRIVLADSGISLDQAVSMVEKRYKARVVRTETRNEGNRKIYVLRLLNDAGRVWTVRVDAASGSVN